MFSPISLEEFESRTGIVPNFTTRATGIVSLRDLTRGSITAVQVMPRVYLEQLLRSVTLVGDKECRPYRDCEINLVRINPSSLAVGQTFVLKNKCLALEYPDDLATDYCIPRSFADRTALIVFGRAGNGEEVLAHYVPPIIEAVNGKSFLLDGVHRNYSALQDGTTVESVVLTGVETPQPFEPQTWSKIKVVEVKPPPEDRFHGLRPELFRDLKWVGING